MKANQDKPLKKIVGRAGVWLVARQLVLRGLPLIQFIILANILTPADFGLYAIAMLVFGFVEAVTYLGFGHALIQRQSVETHHFNTLFIMNFLRGVLVSAFILAVAGSVSRFFNSPESEQLVSMIAVLPIINGLYNPAIIMFQKELNMKQEFLLHVISAAVGFSVSIVLAVHGVGAAALIIGLAIQASVQLLCTYTLHSFRPRVQFTASAFYEMFDFGKWLFLAQGMKYLSVNLPSWTIGRYVGVEPLGLYSVATRFGQTLVSEFTSIISVLAFPLFSKMQSEKKQLSETYLLTQRVCVTGAFLLSSVVIACAEPFVRLVLGPEWVSATSMIAPLAVFAATQSIGSQMDILKSLNRTKLVFQSSLLRLLFISAIIVPATIKFGVIGAIFSITIPAVFLTIVTQTIILRELDIPGWIYGSIIVSAVVGMVSSAFAARVLVSCVTPDNNAGQIILLSSVVVVFIITCLLADHIFKSGILHAWKSLMRLVTTK